MLHDMSPWYSQTHLKEIYGSYPNKEFWNSLRLKPVRNYAMALCNNSMWILFLLFWTMWCSINTLRPRQNGCHFADDTFKRIFLNENVGISINISLKFVSKGLINNIPALVQIMAWRRSGDKPLSEPVMVNLLTHISVTRPQWVKEPSDIQSFKISTMFPSREIVPRMWLLPRIARWCWCS